MSYVFIALWEHSFHVTSESTLPSVLIRSRARGRRGHA